MIATKIKVAATENRRRKVIAGVTGKSVAKMLRILRRASERWDAPIISLMAQQKEDPFLTLNGCILSLRTKDEVPGLACERLFAKARTPESMLAVAPKAVERLIYPVGFYRTKARVIRGICRDLIANFAGRVPDDIDQLLTLNGVG